MLAIVLFLIVIIVYVLFISRSTGLGMLFYHLAMAAEKKAAKLSAHCASINGKQIYYYASEEPDTSKPVLLLIHGFSGDKTIWHRFAKHAHKDYRLIIPDLLGHGDTPYSPEQSYSSFEQTKMLIAFLDVLDISEYSVIGNSMGGMIAMQLLQQDTTRVNKSILLDPAGAASQFALDVCKDKVNPFSHYDFDSFRTFYQASMSKPPFIPRCVLHYVAQSFYINKREQLTHQFTDFFNVDEFFSDKQDIEAGKLMIVWGQEDGLLPVSDAQYWQSITGVVPVIYPGISHMPMVECPQKTYADCSAFLS